MTNEQLAESIDTELIKKAKIKILEDLNRASFTYHSRQLFKGDSSFRTIQDKAIYYRVNQLDIEFNDYWYYLAKNMLLRRTKPTNEEVAHLHAYANAIMSMEW